MEKRFDPKQSLCVKPRKFRSFHECEMDVWDSDGNILTESPSYAKKVAEFLELAPQMFDALDAAMKTNMATMSGSARKKIVAVHTQVKALAKQS